MINPTLSSCRGITLLAAALVAAGCQGTSDGRDDRADSAPPRENGESAGAGEEYASLRAEVCDTLRNSFECARAIEARTLPGAPAAERRGDTLLIARTEGDSVRLVDQEGDASDVALYSYQTRWPDAHQVLVQVQYYEGSEYLLLDTRTGERTSLPHWPLRSPDGERFAVLSFDLEAGYGPNTLQIWELRDGEPELRWAVEPDVWGPREGRWEDPTTLHFVQRGYCEESPGAGRDMCDRPARVTRAADDWRLEAL